MFALKNLNNNMKKTIIITIVIAGLITAVALVSLCLAKSDTVGTVRAAQFGIEQGL